MRRLLIAAAVLAALAGCKGKDQGYSAEEYAKVLGTDNQTTASQPAPSDDVMPSSNAEYLGLFEAKGVHLGMSRDEVSSVMMSRGFFIPAEGGSPMTEMLAKIPDHSAADTAYVDTPACRAEFERHRNLSRDEANSMSNVGYRGCDLALRIFYDSDASVVAFYVMPAGFGLDEMDVRQFADAVVQNLPVAELVPEQQPIRTPWQSGFCTNYVGQATAGERINVSDCGFLRMQVQKSASASGDFQ